MIISRQRVLFGPVLVFATSFWGVPEVAAQGEQLRNSIRNTFNKKGAPDGPSIPRPTRNQWQSGTAYGGWQTSLVRDADGKVIAGTPNVDGNGKAIPGPGGNLVLPSTKRDEQGTLPTGGRQLQFAKIGRPMVLRAVTIPLGSIIVRPERQPDGTPIPGSPPDPDFYLPEPWNAVKGRTIGGIQETAGRFYWSPHAQEVFATEPGNIKVIWKRRNLVVPDDDDHPDNFTTTNIVVSGSPAKTPRRIYWTEGSYNGPFVQVPEERVGAVNVVYTTAFPERVLAEPSDNPLPGEKVSVDYDPENPYEPGNPGVRLPPEVRTLWYGDNDDAIHAYNIEGRVFVEILGDLAEPERIFREHLGFELVDVIKEVRPEEVKVAVGDQVFSVDEVDLSPEEERLIPDVVSGLDDGLADPYLYRHFTQGGARTDLYAIKTTTPLVVTDRNGDGELDQNDEQQSNEVLIYWKESGVQQLLWPRKYVGYIIKWPEEFLAGDPTEADLRKLYSLYARPEVVDDAESSGVQLESTNNPFLAYQDDPFEQHAQLTPQNIFYTVPGTGNRSLIRYTDGEEIWFERVYSQINDDFVGYENTGPVLVGSRIEPPGGIASTVGYIRRTRGDAFNIGAYLDPFVVGFEAAAEGAIIPVNALPDNNLLEIWWYEQSSPPPDTGFVGTHWPSQVRRYDLQWPSPDEAIYDEIVMARNDGSGELGLAATGTIYRQANINEVGYNPNEEHALMSGGVAWALRNDLNQPDSSSEPFVLVDYTAEDGRPAMRVFAVLREKGGATFAYEAPVGVILQAPMPLPFLPLPIEDGTVKNKEVGDATDRPVSFEGNDDGIEAYEKFTYVDRKGSTWIYRGPHAEGVNVGTVTDPAKSFTMNYFYKTQPEFDFPGLTVPPVGTVIPYLSQGKVEDPIAEAKPADIKFIPVWPSNPPVLTVAETLGLPKRGLPAVRGQTSAQILYEQSIAADVIVRTRSAKLLDPTRAKMIEMNEFALDAMNSIETSDYLGKTYFPKLPPHLSQRLYYDPNIGKLGALVFVGEFVDEVFGEDYFLLNVMSEGDLAAAQALDNQSNSAWDTTVSNLSTTLETWAEDPNQVGDFNHTPSLDVLVGIDTPAEIVDDNTAVDSYAINAGGGGTGFVVLAVGDGDVFTPPGEPISLEVFKVAPPLYRGELKVVASANPLDEKLSLQHSGDFAGDPGDYEFAWITGQPINGQAPTLYTYGPLEVLPNGPGRAWKLLNNPKPGYEAARDYQFDDSAWITPGNLGANQISINNGDGTEENGFTLPNAILRETLIWENGTPIDLYLSLEIDDNDGAVVYLNGAEIAVWNTPGRINSEPFDTPPASVSANALARVFVVPSEILQARNTITVDLYTVSDPGARSSFDLRLDSRQETFIPDAWQEVTDKAKADSGEIGKVRHTIEGANIFTLTDNWFTMRYRASAGTSAAFATGGDEDNPGEWSRWLPPQLAEGWIKRALTGINPFDQRLSDLFNNSVNTDVSLLTQAGTRFEGSVALNLANIDDFGLVEIYETILKRGKSLSIEGGVPLNVPSANDALLLAAGYLNDLYLLIGNEAFADAANPTIAFDTEGGDFGEFNTALFAFKGQLATVLEEELALLRGRDDFLAPGVTVAPVYNRLVWNFTGGINSGEPIYSLNYNIQDNNVDGAADAEDAAIQFPQGHGDAYGHYLTALKVYYGLLRNPSFAWAPRIEAVTVLGQPVSVDYQDERKFAAAAAAVTRTASQTLDLTYRQQFSADQDAGWEHLSDGEINTSTDTTRSWGTDEWACRAGQGGYFHWVTANSILPAEDRINEGIQKVDRSTVPELDEVVAQAGAIQTTLDNADARLNPLGLTPGTISFDISPSEIDAGNTHYEQVYERALGALDNAVFAFNNAKRSSEFLRLQENGVSGQIAVIDAQEQAFQNRLIEIYGTPYPGDIGPGKTYAQGYNGPDYFHFAYIDTPELFRQSFSNPEVPIEITEFSLDVTGGDSHLTSDNPITGAKVMDGDSVTYQFSEWGAAVKPEGFVGRRTHPGTLQTAYSDLLQSRNRVRQALDEYHEAAGDLFNQVDAFNVRATARAEAVSLTNTAETDLKKFEDAADAARDLSRTWDVIASHFINTGRGIGQAFPMTIGTSNDTFFVARSVAILLLGQAAYGADIASSVEQGKVDDNLKDLERTLRELDVNVEQWHWLAEGRQLLAGLQNSLNDFSARSRAIDFALREMDQAERDLQALKARALAIQAERETFRKRAAAIIQGYRTRDLTFRVFRDEALEKYKTLFDLAARYTYLAARAYDYETGLLDAGGNSVAASFYQDIVRSRALGVVDSNGDPQFTASTTGDPGLAGVLAAMQGDWSVAESRLGFNNPDNYETTFSLRQEQFRIIPANAGDTAWRDKMASFRMTNVLEDPDVRRYCMQLEDTSGFPVAGLVIPFQTSIENGLNFFGRPLAGGDHTFSPSSFATKIRSSGIAFAGYIGMDAPTSTSGVIDQMGSSIPPDPDLGFLEPEALSATPYIYLVPAGVDSMRSPPLGDTSVVRSWTVDDQAIPLPFNIGNSDFSTNNTFLSNESLSETPFQIRKHQAFRAVPSGTVFGSSSGIYTNSRLIGRSVWNSNWKLIIPGKTLRADPEAGLDVFLDTVTDIELFLRTYSYSGN